MAHHKFKVGQLIHFAPSRPGVATSGRQYEIVRLLPADSHGNGEPQYRVKSKSRDVRARGQGEPAFAARSLVTFHGDAVCRSCGACCAFSKEWPRFSTEDDADLDRIPVEFVDRQLRGIRCEGDRCSALAGEVGVATTCRIYSSALTCVVPASPVTTPAGWRGSLRVAAAVVTAGAPVGRLFSLATRTC